MKKEIKQAKLAYIYLVVFSLFIAVGIGVAQETEDSFIFLPFVSSEENIPHQPNPPALPPDGDWIIVDHTAVDLFDQIPDEYLELAGEIPMMFSDRSVGQNVNEALDCLDSGVPNSDSDWYLSPASCRRDYYSINGSLWESRVFSQSDYEAGQVPERILFDPDPVKYDRSNWVFEYAQGEWGPLTEGFIEVLVPQHIASKTVLTYQFSYLNISEGSTIDDLDRGYFVDLPSNNGERWDISDIEAFEAQNPDKIFIYWTTSLARSIGTIDGENFNNQMRQYVVENDKILFDFADIISRDDNGNQCYDNRDGIPYDNGTNLENYPDDGRDIPAICQDYTTEVDGGHLGAVSGGKIRVAKAYWVLMAQLAGWNP